jgi:hypothetical protein
MGTKKVNSKKTKEPKIYEMVLMKPDFVLKTVHKSFFHPSRRKEEIECLATREQWIEANAHMIKTLGPETYLHYLLRTLEEGVTEKEEKKLYVEYYDKALRNVPPPDEAKEMILTDEDLLDLIGAYNRALTKGEESFYFKGAEVLTSYAGYAIQYIELKKGKK